MLLSAAGAADDLNPNFFAVHFGFRLVYASKLSEGRIGVNACSLKQALSRNVEHAPFRENKNPLLTQGAGKHKHTDTEIICSRFLDSD